jgi:2-octaprenyl-6-methoxyphenol hydroxylase
MIKLPDYDIVIAGGGMIGASLACALCCENIRIAVIEAVSYYVPDQPSYDDRGLALSLSTVQILKALKLWGKVSQSANPIQHIHVSDRHHFGFVRLNAEMLDIPVLGYVVIARELGRALINCLAKAGNVDLFCPAVVDDINIKQEYAEIIIKDDKGLKSIKSKLLVAADGTNSAVREMLGIKTHVTDYEQTAIVTNITPAKSHNNTAYERFTLGNVVLLSLPLIERIGIIIYIWMTKNSPKPCSVVLADVWGNSIVLAYVNPILFYSLKLKSMYGSGL